MSENFQKVKRKMIKEMAATDQHTPESWASIMQNAASRCITTQDQKDFFRFILNPNDSWDVPEPTFHAVDTNEKIVIQHLERMTISGEDEKETEIMFENDVKIVGGTTFIKVKPVKCKS